MIIQNNEQISAKGFTMRIFIVMLTVSLLPGVMGGFGIVGTGGELEARPREDFRAAGFYYYKEIQGYPQTTSAGGAPHYGRIPLDQDLVKYTNLYDLVVTSAGRPAPSFIRPVPAPPGQAGLVGPKVIFNKVRAKKRIYVLELPALTPDREYTALRLEGAGSYEAGVNLGIGEKPENWRSLGYRSIYRYADREDGYSRIRFRSAGAKFLRLEFDSTRRFKFRAEYSSKRRPLEFKTDLGPADLVTKLDTDRDRTLFYLRNSNRRRIHRLVLRFKETHFNRPLEIEWLKPPAEHNVYEPLIYGRVSRKGEAKGEQIIDFSQPVSGALKIAISNQDDAPLTLIGFEAFSPREEIIFSLPGSSEKGTAASPALRVYYGNPYLRPRQTDIRDTFDKKRPIISLTVGTHQNNPDFAYSMLEPPLSSWVIRILFLLTLLLLAWPAYRIFTDYARRLEESTPETPG